MKRKCLYSVPREYQEDIHKHSYQFTNLTLASSPVNALSHLSPTGQHPPTGTKIAVTASRHLCLENPTAPSLLTSYPFLFVKPSLNSVPIVCIMAPA